MNNYVATYGFRQSRTGIHQVWNNLGEFLEKMSTDR